MKHQNYSEDSLWNAREQPRTIFRPYESIQLALTFCEPVKITLQLKDYWYGPRQTLRKVSFIVED